MKIQEKYFVAFTFSVMLLLAASIRAAADFTALEKGDTAMYACNYGDAITNY